MVSLRRKKTKKTLEQLEPSQFETKTRLIETDESVGFAPKPQNKCSKSDNEEPANCRPQIGSPAIVPGIRLAVQEWN